MPGQEWDSVTIIRKRNIPDGSKLRPGTKVEDTPQPVIGARKKTTPPNKNKESLDPRFAAKIDNETESFVLKTIGSDVGKVIQKARAAKGMSQKDLACKINEKVSFIVECESGKLVNTPQKTISKIEKVLDVCLRGKNAGSPLVKKSRDSKTSVATPQGQPSKAK